MDLRKLKTLIDLVESSGIAELEIEEGEERVRITRAVAPPPAPVPAPAAHVTTVTTPAPATDSVPGAEAPASPAPQGNVIKSPMVGTFYRSAAPGSKPFVEVGDAVKEGDPLCIVEAMKLMNEIECDADGIVAEVYPKNAQPVEYGEPLFGIRRD